MMYGDDLTNRLVCKNKLEKLYEETKTKIKSQTFSVCKGVDIWRDAGYCMCPPHYLKYVNFSDENHHITEKLSVLLPKVPPNMLKQHLHQ